MNSTVPSPVLEARGLKKSFPGPRASVEILKQVDFSISAGESISIRGESGSGKTTFLNLLSALEQPSGGDILWRGESIITKKLRWHAQWRARFMGLIFQAYYLMPELNALENVLIAARILGRFKRGGAVARAEALLRRVGLQDRMQYLPSLLSGGERQRVAIARALMNQPPLILADEPTGNLDEKTAQSVQSLLVDLCSEEGASLVLVTHNPQFAATTDRSFHLIHGALVPA